MFLFLSGLSLRFLNATSLPSPLERKVILGVDRSLNLASVLTASDAGTSLVSIPFDGSVLILTKELRKVTVLELNCNDLCFPTALHARVYTQ